jgi:mono/diheme cytochrome c family protein
MPTWKVVYNEVDRWKLVHYIRTFFTQTEDRLPGIQQGEEPKPNIDFQFPDFFRTSMRFPEDVSADRGQVIFLVNCAHCHGLAGDGEGWDGQYLHPKPANFHKKAGKELTGETQGEHMARVTFGIKDAAMPYWGEWLTWADRWDDVKYVLDAWMVGRPVTSSVYGNGEIPANYATISGTMYLSEGHFISETHGADLYTQMCVTCHGETGQGDGPGIVGSASGGPAPFPNGLAEQYIYWRIWEGVPNSVMPPFKWFLTGNDVWDITTWFEKHIGQAGGG